AEQGEDVALMDGADVPAVLGFVFPVVSGRRAEGGRTEELLRRGLPSVDAHGLDDRGGKGGRHQPLSAPDLDRATTDEATKLITSVIRNSARPAAISADVPNLLASP